MLTIRLQRKGKKNQAFFKIVVTEEKRSSTGGRFVEELGFLNPQTKERNLKADRAKYWLSVGAQPSDTVYNMLVSDNIIEGKKRPQHKKSKKKQVEAEATSAAAAETPSESAAEQPAKTEEPAAPVEQPKEKEEESTAQSTPEEPKKEASEGVDKS